MIRTRDRVKRRKKQSRPKTFKSEEAAKAYAETNKIKQYTLKNLRTNPNATPKIKIVC